MPLSEFNKRKAAKDGLYYLCRKCVLPLNKKSYAKNKQSYLLQQRTRAAENPEIFKKRSKEQAVKHKDHISAYQKKYRDCHKEESKKYQHEYYKKYTLYIKDRVSRYAKNNPEKVQVLSENKRARKLGLEDRITHKDWIDLLDKYNHQCLWCGRKGIKLTQDHVIPLSKGGRNVIENIQPLCHSCNSTKHTDIIYFRNSTGRRDEA